MHTRKLSWPVAKCTSSMIALIDGMVLGLTYAMTKADQLLPVAQLFESKNISDCCALAAEAKGAS